ncbi:MAG: porin [Azoarcus sp.]|jgi:predicted porin|nr:porin [Azoarcus sp.]
MQKKLIALAVAGLVSAPAFAQSNVTIYGSIDYGYTLQGRSIYDDVDHRSAIDSGISKSNRLGFKGTEDLGNGLKAVFVLESGITGDGTKDSLWGGAGARQAYAGLVGGFGTVAFGRQYTPQHLFTSAVDPFGKNGLGSAKNVYVGDDRLDNLVAYISPNWGGFSFVTGGTLAYEGNEPVENDNGGTNLNNVRVWAIAPSFAQGPVFVAVNYHVAHVNTSSIVDSLKVWDAFFSYDFGPVKLSAIYGQRKTELTGGSDDVKVKQWLFGGSVPFGASDKVLFSYTHRKSEGLDALNIDDDASLGQWAVGYEHSLSKRTALYVQYAHQHQNSAQKSLGNDPVFNQATGARASSVGYSNLGHSVSSGYRQGLAFGLRHDF